MPCGAGHKGTIQSFTFGEEVASCNLSPGTHVTGQGSELISLGSDRKLKVLWLGCGTEDFAYSGVKAMHDLLAKKDVKHVWNESGGGHSWPNWQGYLAKYAQLLFRD